MSAELFNDPQLQTYIAHAEREMIPQMEKSAFVVSLVSSSVDAKVCLEIGAAVMLDKPIIAVIVQGATVPANLKRVASVIIEGDIKDEATLDKIQQAMTSVIENDGRLKQ